MWLRRCLGLLLALAVSGCSCDEECDGSVSGATIAACVAPEGGWGDLNDFPEDTPFELHVTEAEVVDEGSGVPPDECPLGGTWGSVGTFVDPDHAPLAHWIQFDDDEGARWTAAYVLPVAARFERGDVLEVDFTFRSGGGEGIGIFPGHLGLRGRSGQVVHVAQAADAPRLELPDDLSISRGHKRCESAVWEDDCLYAGEYDLVADSPDGETVIVPYGGRAELGELVLLHGEAVGDRCAADCDCADANLDSFIMGAVAATH